MQMETFGLRAAYALVFGLSEAGLQVPGKPQEYEKAFRRAVDAGWLDEAVRRRRCCCCCCCCCYPHATHAQCLI